MEYFSDILSTISYISIKTFSTAILLELILLATLLIISALISGSEVAFFSLKPKQIKQMEDSNAKAEQFVQKLISTPERLLATILITNNFVNIGIIILSTFITGGMLHFEKDWFKFVFEVVFVTFLILLFGEIIPKVYANQNNKAFSKMMSFPLFYLQKIFYPLSTLLIKSTSLVNKRFTQSQKISMEDISTAIDITDKNVAIDRQILKGAIEFGNADVKEIMTPRVDVVAISAHDKFTKVMQTIVDYGFSRIPVYEDTLDKIKGIIVAKDLIKHINQTADYAWQKHIRKPFYVPEFKKIDDLLQEFRLNRTHLAIVSDEFGGMSGLVTMEDILEEIVGEIKDEFDEPENAFITIDKNNFIFDGKFPIKEIVKILNKETNFFESHKGESETIAGFVLELNGDFPQTNQIINYKDIILKIENVSKRRIIKIKITKKQQ